MSAAGGVRRGPHHVYRDIILGPRGLDVEPDVPDRRADAQDADRQRALIAQMKRIRREMRRLRARG